MVTSWPPMARRGRTVVVEAVHDFESELGLELTDDYRQFLLEVNGGRTARSHSVFLIQRPMRRDAAVLNNLFSLDDQSPNDSRDLRTAQKPSDPEVALPKGLLEIGYDDMGGEIVLPLIGPHRGEVWYINRESDEEDQPLSPDLPPIEWFERRDVWKVASSFEEFMTELGPEDVPIMRLP